jgi:hypothetical protein
MSQQSWVVHNHATEAPTCLPYMQPKISLCIRTPHLPTFLAKPLDPSLSPILPLEITPMRPRRFQQYIRQQPINNRTNTQRHNINPRVRIEIIKFQSLQPRRNRALPTRQPRRIITMKHDIPERIRRKIADRIADRREVVDALEERGHVDGEDAGHELCD